MNNSGATWGAELEKYPDDAFTKLLTLNVQRVFTLTQKLVPLLKKAGSVDNPGRVINVRPALSTPLISLLPTPPLDLPSPWLIQDRFD